MVETGPVCQSFNSTIIHFDLKITGFKSNIEANVGADAVIDDKRVVNEV